MQQLGVCFHVSRPFLCNAELCRRFSHQMGFGLVACWGREALHCCIISWKRFLEANGHCIRTASRARVLLVLAPSNFVNGFWLWLPHLWVRGSDMPSIPSFCSAAHGNTFPGFAWQRRNLEKKEEILLLRWEYSVRKRKDHNHLALSGYMVEHASCTTPILWAQSTEDVPSYLLKTVLWSFGAFFPPRISWAFTKATICIFVIVNLCKLGSSCSST